MLIGGIGGGQVITLLAAPVLTRLYPPSAFGSFGVFVAFVSIGSVLVTFRYEMGIIISRGSSERHGLVALLLWMALGLSIVMAVSWIVFRLIAGRPAGPISGMIASWGPLLLLALVFQGLQLTGKSIALKAQAFGIISGTQVGFSGLQALIQIVVGVIFSGVALGLPLGMTVSLVFVSAWFGTAALREGWVDFGRYRPWGPRVLISARKFDEFPKFMTWSALANSASPQSMVLMISALMGPFVAGQIFLAQRVIKAPMSLLARALQDVNLQEMAEVSSRSLRRIYRRRVGKLLLLGLLPFGVLALVSPMAFEIAFGQVWREAGVFTRILVPGLYFQFVFTPFCPLFTVLRRQDVYMFWSYLRLGLIVVLIYLGWRAFGSRGAVGGFTVATGVSFLVLHVLLERVFRSETAASSSFQGR